MKPNIKKILGEDYINLEKAKEPKVTLAQLEAIKANNQVLIYIPAISAKEVYEKTGNKLLDGKLLYDIDWYKDEVFFSEKAKAGWYIVGKELIPETRNKTYAEQDEILTRLGSGRLSVAEICYFVWAYSSTEKRVLSDWEYHWSSSRSSGGNLVSFGRADAEGAYLAGWEPDDASVNLGVVLSRSLDNLNLEIGTFENELTDELTKVGTVYKSPQGHLIIKLEI